MRTSKSEYFLDIALRSAKQGTCLRRCFGVVLVDEQNTIVSTGYSGAPRGIPHCKTCWRTDNNIPSGTRYEKCKSVHAEQNAIISAPPERLEGATIYIAGFDAKTNEIVLAYPCDLCKRMIVNAGIEQVFYTYIDLLDGHVGFIGCLI